MQCALSQSEPAKKKREVETVLPRIEVVLPGNIVAQTIHPATIQGVGPCQRATLAVAYTLPPDQRTSQLELKKKVRIVNERTNPNYRKYNTR